MQTQYSTQTTVQFVVDAQALENTGYVAFYLGMQRQELDTDAERRGWDEAAGEMSYGVAMTEVEPLEVRIDRQIERNDDVIGRNCEFFSDAELEELWADVQAVDACQSATTDWRS